MRKLLAAAGKLPAGELLWPLLLGAALHTFAPGALEIGSFTTAVFSKAGAATLMGLQMVCLGSRLKLRALPGVLAKSGALLCVRFLSGAACALLFRAVFRAESVGGVCVLTAVAAVSNTNGTVYLSVSSLLGDREAAAGTPILALSNGPMFPLLILGASGFLTVTPLQALALLLPLLIGLLLGNLSRRWGDELDRGVGLLIPFIGFSLGAGIDLRDALAAGLPGAALALAAVVFGGAVLYAADRLLCRRSGGVGLAAAATGANSVAVPAAIASVAPAWRAIVPQATAQLAACAVIGALCVPFAAVRAVGRSGGRPDAN